MTNPCPTRRNPTAREVEPCFQDRLSEKEGLSTLHARGKSVAGSTRNEFFGEQSRLSAAKKGARR